MRIQVISLLIKRIVVNTLDASEGKMPSPNSKPYITYYKEIVYFFINTYLKIFNLIGIYFLEVNYLKLRMTYTFNVNCPNKTKLGLHGVMM